MAALAAAALDWPESSRVNVNVNVAALHRHVPVPRRRRAPPCARRRLQRRCPAGSGGEDLPVVWYGKTMPDLQKHPGTPDRRYFMVAGRLWRMSNPDLAPEQRQQLVERLMDARRQMGAALGERGPVWWTAGAPDFNRRLVADTPCKDWHAALLSGGSD